MCFAILLAFGFFLIKNTLVGKIYVFFVKDGVAGHRK